MRWRKKVVFDMAVASGYARANEAASKDDRYRLPNKQAGAKIQVQLTDRRFSEMKKGVHMNDIIMNYRG